MGTVVFHISYVPKMEQWQELFYSLIIYYCTITIVVSCSSYHNFAAFLHLFLLHWNVDTILNSSVIRHCTPLGPTQYATGKEFI